MVRAARLRRSRDIAMVRAEGRSIRRSAFSVRARPVEDDGVRVAVSAPRTLGAAVVRNRARRRVREAFRSALAARDEALGLDLVITARREALELPFPSLVSEAGSALDEGAAR